MFDQLLQNISAEPTNANHYWEMGRYLLTQNKLEDAYVFLQKAVDYDPGSVFAWTILGAYYNRTGQYDKAKPVFDRALQISPDYFSARWNRYWANLAVGNYEEAWEDQEYGFVSKSRQLRCVGKEWRGEDLKGKVIFVWGEQGLGDQIQFARYLKFLRDEGAIVVFECDAPLVRLLSPLANRVVAKHDTLENPYAYDYQVPLLSLPLYLMRYRGLSAEPDNCGAYLGIEGEGDHIGFFWKGRETHPNDGNRSLTDDEAKLMEGVATMGFGENFPFEMESGRGADFWATAQNLAKCRVLVTVDSGIAHLAGAMGKEVWMMTPLNGEGRWGMSGERTAWYQSMRVFRPTDFSQTLEKIKEDLNGVHVH